jgi:hypothetical protein
MRYSPPTTIGLSQIIVSLRTVIQFEIGQCKVSIFSYNMTCNCNITAHFPRSGRGVQHYVIKFVTYLRHVGGFLRFPPPRYNWNIVESSVKNHQTVNMWNESADGIVVIYIWLFLTKAYRVTTLFLYRFGMSDTIFILNCLVNWSNL